MTKDAWLKHMEEEGIVRPSKGGDILTWKETQKAHKDNGCKECKARRGTIQKNQAARDKNHILRDLCGTSARAAKLDMGL